jgi:hypothetical protein
MHKFNIMEGIMTKLIVLAAALLFKLAPLAAHTHTVVVEEVVPTTQVVVVNEAPPAPIVEQACPCPGSNYAYVEGHWEWNNQWVWKTQQWVIKPHSGACWEPAHWHWSHHHHGYVWEAGHWK